MTRGIQREAPTLKGQSKGPVAGLGLCHSKTLANHMATAIAIILSPRDGDISVTLAATKWRHVAGTNGVRSFVLVGWAKPQAVGVFARAEFRLGNRTS